MIKFHLTIFLRRVGKNVFFNLVNFIGITVALTVTMVIISFVAYERSFDNFHSENRQIYRVVQDNVTANGIDHWSTTAYPLAEALRNDFSDVEVTQTAGPVNRLFSVADGEKLKDFEVDQVLFADTAFFKMFDYQLLEGDFWIQGELSIFKKQNNSILLTTSLANKLYGEEHGSLIGKEIELNKNSVLSVAGVINDPPLNSNIRYEALVNFFFFKDNNPYHATNWSGNYQGYTYVKLPQNLNVEALKQRLPAFESKYLSDIDNKRINYKLQLLTCIHNDTSYSDTISSYALSNTMLSGLLSVVLLLIVISCTNYINLASAMVIKRSKEVVLHKMFGDSKGQLITRYLIETALIIFVAAVHAVVFAQYIIELINSGTLGLPFSISITIEVVVLLALICLLVILVTSLYPVIMMSRFNPLKVLKDNSVYSNNGSGSLVRRIMIFVQFSFVHIMVVGIAVVYFQMSFIKGKDLGFEHDSIFTFNIPEADSLKIERLRQVYSNHHSIEAVSFSSGVPFESDFQYGTNFRLSNEPEEMKREAEMKVIDVDYASLYNLELVAGSWVTDNNKLPWQQGFNGFVVNETLARQLGVSPDELIGKKIIINEVEAEVIGVVKDFHNMWLKQQIKPCIMFYWGTGFYSKAALRIAHKENIEQTISFVEQQWKKEYPEYNFQSQWFDERIDSIYEMDDLTFAGLKIAGLIAIIVGSSGLLALMVFYSESRTKELGIRKILGASASQLAFELSSGFMKQVCLSIVVGTCLGWWLTFNWLNTFTYKMEANYLIYFLAAVITILVAVLSIIHQTIKSASVNPSESLRYE